MKKMLQVEAVTKTFDDLVALDKVDLSLKQGRSLALIGPAAAGKSVLLKCLVGLYAPSEGVIRIDGQEVGTAAQRPKALSHRIGMLFQQNALFDSLTVWENIAFRLMVDGMGRRAAPPQLVVRRSRRNSKEREHEARACEQVRRAARRHAPGLAGVASKTPRCARRERSCERGCTTVPTGRSAPVDRPA